MIDVKQINKEIKQMVIEKTDKTQIINKLDLFMSEYKAEYKSFLEGLRNINKDNQNIIDELNKIEINLDKEYNESIQTLNLIGYVQDDLRRETISGELTTIVTSNMKKVKTETDKLKQKEMEEEKRTKKQEKIKKENEEIVEKKSKEKIKEKKINDYLNVFQHNVVTEIKSAQNRMSIFLTRSNLNNKEKQIQKFKLNIEKLVQTIPERFSEMNSVVKKQNEDMIDGTIKIWEKYYEEAIKDEEITEEIENKRKEFNERLTQGITIDEKKAKIELDEKAKEKAYLEGLEDDYEEDDMNK